MEQVKNKWYFSPLFGFIGWMAILFIGKLTPFDLIRTFTEIGGFSFFAYTLYLWAYKSKNKETNKQIKS